ALRARRGPPGRPGRPPPVNAAVTRFAASIATVHEGSLPRQAPPQPPNFAPAARLAVRPTVEPCRSCARHTDLPLPQVIPPPVTVPRPVTATLRSTSAAEP